MLQILILRGKGGKGAKKGCEGVVSEEEEEEKACLGRGSCD